MLGSVDDWLARSEIYRRLKLEDRARLAKLAQVRSYGEGRTIFAEGDPSSHFITIVQGHVKVVKNTAAGKEVILELFGAGEPLGVLAAYEGHPFPATAVATEPTTCLLLPRDAFYALLEEHPSMVRGLLAGLTLRQIQLTNRLAELGSGRVESRLARLLLKLAGEVGTPTAGGTFIPLRLKRQELADFVGTTVETAIRIMSRWSKGGIVRTRRDGFLLVDRPALEAIGAGES
ncbi:MAG: Crp/Fnr family transcriptional regulator [Holophagales bacterium]|nr:MAG: Crp/Fnr family transcriptional regulator [Holophagales bacterium]